CIPQVDAVHLPGRHQQHCEPQQRPTGGGVDGRVEGLFLCHQSRGEEHQDGRHHWPQEAAVRFEVSRFVWDYGSWITYKHDLVCPAVTDPLLRLLFVQTSNGTSRTSIPKVKCP